MARLLTHPRWPDMTRMSFHGGCQSGLSCCILCLWMRVDDGMLLCDVDPLVVHCVPALSPLPRTTNAELTPPPAPGVSALGAIFSISLVVFGSDKAPSCCSGFVLFRRFAAAEAALACLAANAGGNSRTPSYSLRIRQVKPTLSITWKGESVEGSTSG